LQADAPKVCHTVQEWVEGEETECPVLFINEYAEAFKARKMLEKGILPHSGGYAEQPALLMRCVNIINEVVDSE